MVSYFGRWVPPKGAVLDLGAGYCEFINNVSAGTKYAMDLNPEILNQAESDVKIFQQDCSDSWPLFGKQFLVIARKPVGDADSAPKLRGCCRMNFRRQM
ncbi:MAG TPA: hypothetical protein VNI36_09110 [Candidatus Dormibacteraeota bacterium]|nr:hypothetical protein [Candidatus Dormibacteraeota bacterium]